MSLFYRFPNTDITKVMTTLR